MTILQLLKLLVPELSQTLALLSLYGSIALALITCFFGYRLRQLLYGLFVFGIGALLGFLAGKLFLPEQPWLCVLIGLGCGLILSLFTFRIYQAVAFAVAFFSVFSAIGEVLGDLHPTLALIVALVLAILAGILAARFQFWTIILLTSVSGGWRAASALRRCLPAMSFQTMLLVALCVIVAGVLFQALTAKKTNRIK